MPDVDTGGLRIAYERAGEGPPLVFLHGVLGDSREWRRQTSALSDEFTVIAWDAPGCGRSSDPAPPFGTADWAGSLAGLLEAIGVEQTHVAGLSWGGTVALELYRLHPERVRSLILADTYAGWKGSLPPEVCAARVETCLREAEMPPSALAARWLPSLLPESAPPELADEIAAVIADCRPAMLGLMAQGMGSTDQRDLLPHIDVPTLLLWGEADQRSPLSVAEQFREASPGARLVVIPEAGHMSNMEQPERFNAVVRRFCRGIA
jgi:pimeloyl-ACP methyl ester carboxylesterase